LPASPGYCRWNDRFDPECFQAKQSLTRLHVAHETYYWAYVVEYFSPWVSLARTKEEIEPAVEVADMLDEIGMEENEVLTVPEIFRVPSCQIAAV